MTEREWLECTDPQTMLEFVGREGSDRKNQLFSCACCRKVWHLLTPDVARQVVEIGEHWADGRHGETAANEVYDATERATAYFNANYMHRNGPAYAAATRCGYIGVPSAGAQQVCQLLGKNACPTAEPLPDEFFCQIMREIFNPFYAVRIDRAWQTPTVLAVAQAAYDKRILPAGTLDPDCLAILADALEEAGCDSQDLLGHLRQPGSHYRGCWALDRLLAKE